jgi:translation initiation factor IF-2
MGLYRRSAGLFSGSRTLLQQKDRSNVSLKTPTVPPGGSSGDEDKLIEISGPVTVTDLATKLNVRPQDIQRELMNLGVLANLTAQVSAEHAAKVAEKLGWVAVTAGAAPKAAPAAAAGGAKAPAKGGKKARPSGPTPRPPIIVVMGHVDHGKTTLLDTVRRTDVAAHEFGGITQHIGAFQTAVETEEVREGRKLMKRITFLDTPGHEAFTQMRARGSSVADVAILVVAADDGVMPQTIEAIDHAKAAGVPIIVAVNKVDLPDADPTRVLTELTQHNLIPEDFGGEIGTVQVSAKEGLGVDDLLERILLEAEVLELTADSNGPAEGVIIEARLDPGKGPVATVLIESGSLFAGDSVVVGTIYGKIKAMTDDRGQKVNRAGPATPVEILGLSGVPAAGDRLMSVESDREARQLAQDREVEEREAKFGAHAGKISLENLFRQIQQGDVKELNLILKADVQGSVEAVRESLEKLSTDEVRVKILRAAVGSVGENDILLASASNAIVFGFNVKVDPAARRVATDEGIEVRTYRIIYELIEAVEAAMRGLLAPVYQENKLGRAEVRATFKLPNNNVVAGCYVQDGLIRRGADLRVLRGKEMVYEGSVDSLRHIKENVREMAAGYECGVIVDGFNDFKEGDILECYEMQQIARELRPARPS